MALETDNIKTGGDGGTPKTLGPGNAVCKLNGVTLEDFKFKPGALHVILHLEGPELPDFEGFWLNKDDQSLGRYKGQVGKVKASEWAYADGTTKSGVEITRDSDILKVLKNLCTAFNCNDWLVAQNKKHDTIEQLIGAFNDEKPFGEKRIEFCIGGKEYTNKNGYTDYDLFLPKYSKAGPAFAAAEKPVVKFNPEEHIRKKKVDPVSEFEADASTELSSAASDDFKLDEN